MAGTKGDLIQNRLAQKKELHNYLEYYFRKSDLSDGSNLPKKRTYYEYDEFGRIKKIVRIK